MRTVNLAAAKAQLSELIYRAESGEEILVTRHGQPVVRISAVQQPKQPVPLERLAALRKNLPPWEGSSAKILRELRDEE